jgi:predicted dehydrogenase
MGKTVVIIGMGGHAQGSWFKEIKKHPGLEVIGVVDTNTELLSNLEHIGLSEDVGFTSIDDAVRCGVKPDIAVVATPIYTHHVLCRETMELGINVICEKNMASTIYQGRQMVQCAKDFPELCTAIGTQYRYWNRNWCAKAYFHQPEVPIGPISFLRWESSGNWGEKRSGWRRFLQEVYLEDMALHHFDLMRYVTGMDIVQAKCDTFIPRYSKWQGSSTVFVNFALAKPEDYDNRRNWVWAQYYGDWQRRGPGTSKFEIFCEKGQAEIGGTWLDLKIYEDEEGKKWEEDGYLPGDAGLVEGLGINGDGQQVILEMMIRGIDSKGKVQPGTNFCESFKSFAASMAAIESSRTGKSVWVPDYWKGLLE